MEAVWNKVKSSIKKRIPAHSYKMWIEPLKVGELENNSLIVFCPNFFSRKRVQGLYGEMLKIALETVLGHECVS